MNHTLNVVPNDTTEVEEDGKWDDGDYGPGVCFTVAQITDSVCLTEEMNE